MTEILEYALSLATNGFHVIPCGGQTGKVPMLPRWQIDAPREEAAVRRIFTRYRAVNVGIVCDLSGVAVLDIDPIGVPWLEARRDRLPPTLVVPTRRADQGAQHWFYRLTPGHHFASSHGDGVDIRCRAGQVIAWRPDLLDMAAMTEGFPMWVLDELPAPAGRPELGPRGGKRRVQALLNGPPIEHGAGHHAALLSIIGHCRWAVREGWADEDQARERALRFNIEKLVPPASEREFNRCWNDARRRDAARHPER